MSSDLGDLVRAFEIPPERHILIRAGFRLFTEHIMARPPHKSELGVIRQHMTLQEAAAVVALGEQLSVACLSLGYVWGFVGGTVAEQAGR